MIELVAGNSLLANLGAEMNFDLNIVSKVSYAYENNIRMQDCFRRGEKYGVVLVYLGYSWLWYRYQFICSGGHL